MCANPENYETCPACGALMGDKQSHFEWHVGTSDTEQELRIVLERFNVKSIEDVPR